MESNELTRRLMTAPASPAPSAAPRKKVHRAHKARVFTGAASVVAFVGITGCMAGSTTAGGSAQTSTDATSSAAAATESTATTATTAKATTATAKASTPTTQAITTTRGS